MPPSQPLPSTFFSTEPVPGEDRFEAWRSGISVVFDVAPLLHEAANDFHASVRATHLGNLLLGDLHFGAQQFSRSMPRVARDGLDHYLVQWYRSGGFVGQIDGGEDITVRPGDITVLDLERTLRTWAKPSHVMTLILPRELVHEAMGTGDMDLHGTVLSSRSPLGGLFSDHLLSVDRRLSEISEPEAPGIAQASIQMLAACIRPTAQTQTQARVAIEQVTLERIQHHIGRHLGTALSPETLGRQFGLSRSALYRIFEPLGGVAHYVQQRRLLHAFHALTNPANRQLRVNDIASRAGFSSNAHFSRAFRTTFGVTPREVRAMTAGMAENLVARPDGSTRLSVEYADWVRSLQRS